MIMESPRTPQAGVTGPLITSALGAGLVGTVVKWRPYYHVPTGTSSLKSARSPWTRRFLVIRGSATSDTVTLGILPTDEDGPWRPKQFAQLRELHDNTDCACLACTPMGDGIHMHTGA
mgnify:CR=1 FL=1